MPGPPPKYFQVRYTCPWCEGPGSWKLLEAPPGARVQCTFWCQICKKLVGITCELGRDYATAIDTFKAAIGGDPMKPKPKPKRHRRRGSNG